MTDAHPGAHLSEPEVAKLLKLLEGVNAVLVGGQALAIWSRLFLKVRPVIAGFYSISSEDLDVFGNVNAAKAFAEGIDESVVHIPKSFDNNTPNAAVVTGKIGDRLIRIDFMRSILGVEDRSIREKYVTLRRQLPDGKTINIIVLHPLDCLKSRISNINDLGRRDPHSISSARAAMYVLEAFIDELLAKGQIKEAQDILLELGFVARDRCFGKPVHAEFGIDPRVIMTRYIYHPHFDKRWLENQLRKSLGRLERSAVVAAKRIESKKQPTSTDLPSRLSD
ncbi:hypothetical protein FXB40_28910 [Bradyrhizobium rifense]|uniref:Nucleotidyl transferase AbiEii/AbiGii toxin family protein n=1 Tax=Bradyrhizobium rifense TaxID=515499 RepID=A0A5D3K7K2_9BRAD|nr:hypothetical protein [Bradyrhizobium rifense]TYL91324.1 hypothetical protein FXB40_28910 [Bradyrhizobium rifense]